MSPFLQAVLEGIEAADEATRSNLLSTAEAMHAQGITAPAQVLLVLDRMAEMAAFVGNREAYELCAAQAASLLLLDGAIQIVEALS